MSELTVLDDIRSDVDVIKSMLQDGIPPGATAMIGQNAAAVAADNTPQELSAAPGAGYRQVVTKAIFTALTAAEDAVLKLQDDTAVTPIILAGPFLVGDPAIAGEGHLEMEFNPPLRNTENKALDVCCVGDTGDSFAHVQGWVELIP